jgi:fructoselysine-6-P-deglycase FrlB-like protein
MSDDQIPLRPLNDDFVETVKSAVSQRERARQLTSDAVKRGVDKVYFVGCGGSLYATYPAQFLVDTIAEHVTAFHYTSSEFNLRKPRQLGEQSLVVVGSHSGSTRETIEAVSVARQAGATVFGVTRSTESALAKAVDEVFTYGSEHTVWEPKQVLLANIAHGLIQASGTHEDVGTLALAYDALPEAIFQGLVEYEARSHEIASELKDEPIIYVLGSGPVEGAARCFSMCYLQEMQWTHSAAFNSGEFFHGAFEVVNDDVPVILLAGEDATRPMAERARSFLGKYAKKNFVIDSRELSLPGVPKSARGEVAPIALGAIVTRLSRHFESQTGHDLDSRRYMTKVDY